MTFRGPTRGRSVGSKARRRSSRDRRRNKIAPQREREILDVFERLGLSEEYKRAAYRSLGNSVQTHRDHRPIYFIRFSSSTG